MCAPFVRKRQQLFLRPSGPDRISPKLSFCHLIASVLACPMEPSKGSGGGEKKRRKGLSFFGQQTISFSLRAVPRPRLQSCKNGEIDLNCRAATAGGYVTLILCFAGILTYRCGRGHEAGELQWTMICGHDRLLPRCFYFAFFFFGFLVFFLKRVGASGNFKWPWYRSPHPIRAPLALSKLSNSGTRPGNSVLYPTRTISTVETEDTADGW